MCGIRHVVSLFWSFELTQTVAKSYASNSENLFLGGNTANLFLGEVGAVFGLVKFWGLSVNRCSLFNWRSGGARFDQCGSNPSLSTTSSVDDSQSDIAFRLDCDRISICFQCRGCSC